jgi:hypothetical protein
MRASSVVDGLLVRILGGLGLHAGLLPRRGVDGLGLLATDGFTPLLERRFGDSSVRHRRLRREKLGLILDGKRRGPTSASEILQE